MIAWEYRPRADRGDPTERESVARALRSSLRVGHGLGAAFAVRWTGGRSSRILVRAAGRTAQRWVRELLIPSFAGGPWTEAAELTPGPPGARARFALPRVGFSFPVSTRPEEPSWGDVLASALPQLRNGVTIDWEFHPAGPPLGSLGGGGRTAALEPVPPGWRPPPVPIPERRAEEGRIDRAFDLRWAARGTVEADDGIDPVAAVTEATTVVGRAVHHPASDGLRFAGRFPLVRPVAPWFVVSEREVLGALPSPWSRLRSSPIVGTSETSVWWIGPEGRAGSVPLPVDAVNGRHLIITGETGMGKSSLVVRLAVQAARKGAVVMLDPIGDTAERFLATLPTSARARATWVSPARSPVGLNALRPFPRGRESGADPERAVQDLVHALRRVRSQRFPDVTFWGPRIEESVTMALRAATHYPEGTLETAARILERADHPGGSVPEAARPSVAALRDRVVHRPEEVDGARRLLSEIVGSPSLCRLLCEPHPRWSFSEALRPDGITVISGDAALAGEATARYLLAVHLALLWSAVVLRPLPRKTFVFLDEAQWFAHESASEMFRMGRRFNLHLVLATQALGSLPEALRDAALTNSADMVLFRGSPVEARDVARWAPSLPPERMLSLPQGHAAVLVDKGRMVEWAVVPALRPSSMGTVDLTEIAARSWASYGIDGPTMAAVPTSVDGPSAAPGSPDRTSRGGGDGPSRRRVLVLLASVPPGTMAGEILRVPVNFLRDEADPGGKVVRQIGRDLRAAGILDHAARADGGKVWSVRSDAIPSFLDPPPTDEERAEARARWRRWTGNADSSPRQGF
ncbi:MAG: helicase HerA domain-containing protein [Thermoplasmata archaeon]